MGEFAAMSQAGAVGGVRSGVASESVPKAASARTRILGGVAVALAVHACVVVALRPARAERSAVMSAMDRRAAARTERLALLRSAEGDVATGRVTLGETIVRLGWLDRVEEAEDDGAGSSSEVAERERALAEYRAMLADVRGAVAGGAAVEEAIVAAIARDGRAGRYKRGEATASRSRRSP
jgi:hypothetical protein